jgi:hypothetical protein
MHMHWYHIDGMSADAHANGEKKCPQLGDGEHDDNLKAARLDAPEYQKGHRRREACANDCSFAEADTNRVGQTGSQGSAST